VITWAVPKDMPFEASALEEFLIKELAAELPDNTAGKNTITRRSTRSRSFCSP